MFKAKITFLLVVVFAAAAFADGAGSTTAAFLKIGVGARAVGMGEAASALAAGPEALYWNPAGLAASEQRVVSFTHNEWLQDIRYEYLGISYPLMTWGSLGFAAGRVSMGELVGMDEQGNPTGNFGASDMALSVGYARALWPFLTLGVQGEYVTSKIETETASAVAGGVGATVKTPLQGLSAGVAASNIGGEMKFIQEGSPLPLAVRGGFAYLLPFGGEKNKLTVAVDGLKYRDINETYVNSGVEYWFMDMVAGRAGYKANYDEDGLTAGLGFKYHAAENLAVGADYAYAAMGIWGATHRVSLGVQF